MNVEPLWSLRVRTPRLVLRLPTEDELVELFRIAEGGIHPPEEMPFYVPWTDGLDLDGFLAFHRAAWAEWRPEKWTLNLITFLDGEPIGSQGAGAEDFTTKREVETGSWLGAPFQGKGLGTEQRAAVLELAFSGLGADAAVSGSFVHNVKSQRVSEKLGYRVAGTRTMESRGAPVEHLDYRLDRADWLSPVAVEIAGLGPALPLFGAG
ncbi:MAG TPA: GNAT family protein [Gaiellaceae bacterium]|nr:GNAT family protein [Gaiellaceae bacterium]